MRLNAIGSITRDVWTRPSQSLQLWGLLKSIARQLGIGEAHRVSNSGGSQKSDVLYHGKRLTGLFVVFLIPQNSGQICAQLPRWR